MPDAIAHSKPSAIDSALQSLSIGVAIVNSDGWSIAVENRKFAEWFPRRTDAHAGLSARIEGLEEQRVAAGLLKDRKFLHQTMIRNQGREVHVGIEFTSLDAFQPCSVLVECHDVSREKQKEYMLESYSRLAERHARELEREKERAERLLLNIMPRSVYEEMKHFGTVTPQRFDHASVLLLDFVGFTEMAVAASPGRVLAELNDIFSSFDRIVERFGCERIKTIGDAYMAVAGIPEPNPEHAHCLARVALRMRRYIERRNQVHPETWRCRIGLATGPVVGSIVGVHKYVYDIFGPGVNLAARMESLSQPMKITISEPMYLLIRDHYLCEDRGEFDVKGFGSQKVYSLEGEHGFSS
jgi:class 3 adenylate cyclase